MAAAKARGCPARAEARCSQTPGNDHQPPTATRSRALPALGQGRPVASKVLVVCPATLVDNWGREVRVGRHDTRLDAPAMPGCVLHVSFAADRTAGCAWSYAAARGRVLGRGRRGLPLRGVPPPFRRSRSGWAWSGCRWGARAFVAHTHTTLHKNGRRPRAFVTTHKLLHIIQNVSLTRIQTTTRFRGRARLKLVPRGGHSTCAAHAYPPPARLRLRRPSACSSRPRPNSQCLSSSTATTSGSWSPGGLLPCSLQ
jgi:hypothetical protein